MADDGRDNEFSLPLRGAVVCCTSIPPDQRSELAQRAQEMGAIHQLDLTSDVTHLLVGDTETPKYRYVARERPDVKVLQPDFIEALRDQWVQNDKIDIEALHEEYRLPTLSGLQICLTGFDNAAERQQLQSSIMNNGASYHGDLTKSISHLIANTTEGAKFKYATLWGLKIVSVEWLRDSLVRGMTLDETIYSPAIPKEERGKNAWVQKSKLESNLGKRPFEVTRAFSGGLQDSTARRKLRRTTSNKLHRQNSGIWGDIVGGAKSRNGSPVENGKADANEGDKHPVARATDEKSQARDHPPQREQEEQAADGIFAGCHLYLHAFDEKKTAILRKHLVSNDATILTTVDELPTEGAFAVIPHDLKANERPELSPGVQMVNEWWIESCLHRKAHVDPRENILHRPFYDGALDSFQGLTICSTGFSGIDVLHLSKAIKLLGANYDEYLSQQISVLVCSVPLTNQEKIRHAFAWSVPVVKAAWLWDSIIVGQKQDLKKYAIKGTSNEGGQGERVEGSSRHAKRASGRNKPSLELSNRKSSPVTAGDRPYRSPSPAPAAASASGPFLEEDVPHDDDYESEAPSNAGSPAVTTTKESSKTTHDSGNLQDSISALLARRREASAQVNSEQSNGVAGGEASVSTVSLNFEPRPNSGRRKPRQQLLGKAVSNLSSRTLSRAGSVASANSDQSESSHQDTAASANPEPSQQVLYDDPEGREQRERVLRKVQQRSGGVPAERGPEAPTEEKGLGLVKDREGPRTRTRAKRRL